MPGRSEPDASQGLNHSYYNPEEPLDINSQQSSASSSRSKPRKNRRDQSPGDDTKSRSSLFRPELRRETGEARKETRRETRKETHRESRTTETMSGTHGIMRTLQSHVSAVTSRQIEHHPEGNFHALDPPLQTLNIDLLEAIRPATVAVTLTVNGTVTLIDPAAPQLMQATMRGIDDVQAIAHSPAKQTTAMTEGATKIGGVTKTEVVTKTDTVTGIVHLLTAT
ncbi:hypothetical protein MKX08_003545 [Trichoderma sp. CBMAI-0020]|nr:hypothetical protein MKX08_003545 [Trichoderma sp. CBMAI-0020]